jgi:hypothetical protein
VTRPPLLLLTILVYVSLDFCLPAMPGAFVFEAADSVDTIQVSRADADLVAAPALAKSPLIQAVLQIDLTNGPVLWRAVTPAVRPVMARLPRAMLRPSVPSEDPH